jgi:DNA repair photolyase
VSPWRRFVSALEEAGFDVIDHDLEQGPTVTFAVGPDAVRLELARRDEDAPCYRRTARFNVSARALRRAGDLGAAGRRAVDRALAILAAHELDAAPRAPVEGRVEVTEVRAGRALVDEGDGRYYLDPYVGCVIGCPFCWVADRADLGRALEGRPPRAWGRWVDVKVNLPERLREEVRRLPPGVVRMSPVVTDPYQPIERRYRITRRALEVLLPAGFTPVVLTRARRVLDDLELLRAHPNVAVGVSIPTDDDAVRRAFEPGADPIEVRLEVLRTLHAAGVVTFAVVQPALPMNPARLVSAIAPHVAAVRLDRMHEVKRALPLYAAAGVRAFAEPGPAEGLVRELHRRFSARGVPIDARDDLAGLVLDAIARRGG